jgi:hypothetical protein
MATVRENNLYFICSRQLRIQREISVMHIYWGHPEREYFLPHNGSVALRIQDVVTSLELGSEPITTEQTVVYGLAVTS